MDYLKSEDHYTTQAIWEDLWKLVASQAHAAEKSIEILSQIRRQEPLRLSFYSTCAHTLCMNTHTHQNTSWTMERLRCVPKSEEVFGVLWCTM